MARPLPMSDKMTDLVARRFRMLGDVTRLRILQALEEGEKSVGAITERVTGTQSNISKHLQALMDAGILNRRRDGNNVLYSIADPVIFRLCDLVCHSTTSRVHSEYGELIGSSKGRRR